MKHSEVVPYIGTWIETGYARLMLRVNEVVPYIGTWIETYQGRWYPNTVLSYLI